MATNNATRMVTFRDHVGSIRSWFKTCLWLLSPPSTLMSQASLFDAAVASRMPSSQLLRATDAARCAELLGGRLVVRNTFIHYEEPRQLLRASRSAPALRATSAGLGEPPSSSAVEWRTTLLLRNLPYVLTRDMFVQLLDSHGFRTQYDLVYLPVDFKTNQNLGYGFVNAVSPEIATRFFIAFDGFQAWPKKSLKTCSVCWSDRQGLESNIRVYRNLGVMKQPPPRPGSRHSSRRAAGCRSPRPRGGCGASPAGWPRRSAAPTRSGSGCSATAVDFRLDGWGEGDLCAAPAPLTVCICRCCIHPSSQQGCHLQSVRVGNSIVANRSRFWRPRYPI
ncbi:unnamed protein product [Prorocentrum cordatum]|uniref:Mei2-like C-terminal RNA recognition motif domain-containing protein n=1 Tax=Prorocentrum cordatum TaxID=2364126 RepID=A0ABN9R511_9DINO|nr:unnamed protein product [Polarella glacialis]